MNAWLTRESLAVHLPLVIFLAAIACQELATKRISNKWLLPGLIYFGVARLVVGPLAVSNYLAGGAVFFAAMWLLWMFGVLGGGAVKLAAVVGVALGARPAIAAASLQGLIFLVLLGAIGLREKRRQIAQEELSQFFDADHERATELAASSVRSLASSPFCLVTVLGVLVWQSTRA